MIFSKKEITGHKVTKEVNVGRRILDQVCNTIWKSAHHKGGSCLQLHLYKHIIIWKREWSWNKVRKVGNIESRILDHVSKTISKSAHQKIGPCLQLHEYKNMIFKRRSCLGTQWWKKELLGGNFRACLQHHFKVYSYKKKWFGMWINAFCQKKEEFNTNGFLYAATYKTILEPTWWSNVFT
jgi:hypothetical protein